MKTNDTRFDLVYCVNCLHFGKLMLSADNDYKTINKPCLTCYPYNQDDGFTHLERPHYEDSEIKPLW